MLTNLACKSAANKVAIAEAGAIPPLVALVANGTAGCQEKAASTLRNLAHENAANQHRRTPATANFFKVKIESEIARPRPFSNEPQNT